MVLNKNSALFRAVTVVLLCSSTPNPGLGSGAPGRWEHSAAAGAGWEVSALSSGGLRHRTLPLVAFTSGTGMTYI